MKKILFIVNPVSGGKDKEGILRIVGEEIGRKRFEYETVLTACPGHATSIASECDADIVVAVGGDGTVSEVAKGIAGTSKTLGIIPCGSGDGLALHLGISRNPRKAARQLCEARFVPMDYGLVCGHPFFCTTGVGFDAVVSK